MPAAPAAVDLFWAIRTGENMEGDLPRKQARLVVAWAELHQEELMADWRLVMNGEEPFKIQPLQ
ncbi:MAG: DUF4160 domain-containing protein [Thermodesulfobacteriota bacterium]